MSTMKSVSWLHFSGLPGLQESESVHHISPYSNGLSSYRILPFKWIIIPMDYHSNGLSFQWISCFSWLLFCGSPPIFRQTQIIPFGWRNPNRLPRLPWPAGAMERWRLANLGSDPPRCDVRTWGAERLNIFRELGLKNVGIPTLMVYHEKSPSSIKKWEPWGRYYPIVRAIFISLSACQHVSWTMVEPCHWHVALPKGLPKTVPSVENPKLDL